jgi:hypothetical protein
MIGLDPIHFSDLLKKLYSDTQILSKYILSAETMVNDGFSYSKNV